MEVFDFMNENNRKHVLGIVGSPRRGGNTEVLVDEVLVGAARAGAVTENVILNELNIMPCRACDACKNGKDCVQQDDMAELLVQMDQSQVWVLGTPIYWWGPTAQFKAFIDRWYGSKQMSFARRRAILVIPLGGSVVHFAFHTIGILIDILNYLGMELFATVLVLNSYSQGAVHNHTDILAKARHAGREAIEKRKEK